MPTLQSFSTLLLLLLPLIRSAEAFFSTIQSAAVATKLPSTSESKCRLPHHRPLLRAALANPDDIISGDASEVSSSSSSSMPLKKKKGDSLRDATGIRPSLHPTTINCVAEALLLRSQCVLLGKSQNKDGEEISIDTANSQTEPIQIAITAAGIAMSAIDQRSDAAKTDETTDEFNVEEKQTISGRVVGVVMRMRELEQLVIERVHSVKWVRKYGEEESFGVLKKECQKIEDAANDEGKQSSPSPDSDEALEKQLAETIKINPLFRMNRAECLLALFLSTVEQPKLDMLGEGVAGGSNVDFIDADRLEVLLRDT
ncbi:hypothetical protein ACHAXR_007209 [Thalassiosira sp. AJA248-18]